MVMIKILFDEHELKLNRKLTSYEREIVKIIVDSIKLYKLDHKDKILDFAIHMFKEGVNFISKRK